MSAASVIRSIVVLSRAARDEAAVPGGGLVHQRVQLLVGLAVLVGDAEHVAVLVGVDDIVAVRVGGRTFGWVVVLPVPVAGVDRVARRARDAARRVHDHLLVRRIVQRRRPPRP